MNTIDMHSPVNSVALHDGLYDDLLAVGTDNYFRLFDIHDFKALIRDYRSNEDYEPEILIENLIDFRSNRILKPIRRVSFSTLGRFIAIASKSRVLIYDKRANSFIKEIDAYPNDIIALDFIDVEANFVLGYSNFIEVWSIDGDKPIKRFEPIKGSTKTFSSLASNTRREASLGLLYSRSTEGSMVRLWNENTNSEEFREFKFQYLTSLTFTPDGKSLMLGGNSDQIILWNFLDDNIKMLKGGSKEIMNISFHENYECFATSFKKDYSIRIWEKAIIPMTVYV